MAGGIIIKQSNIKKKLNVLIITPAPNETSPQFTDDLFKKFSDFNKFKIHDIKNGKSLENITMSNNNIFIVSKQLLQKYIEKKTIKVIKELKLDIIIVDENHFHGTTDLSKSILNSYSSENTVKIYLTATFNKPLKEWNILPECQMFWDIEDEQICKLINKSIKLDNSDNLDNCLNQLKEKHGESYVNNTILHYTNLNESIKDIFKIYKKMPDLHIITNLFNQEKYETLKNDFYENNNEYKMGFCFETLFALNNDKTKFIHVKEIKVFLRYISGSYKEQDGNKTIFTRIENICANKKSRLPFTQIWFLPSCNINEISCCLKDLMLNDKILSNYEILCVNSNNKDLPCTNIKNEISKLECKANHDGKSGVIILAGNMLTLGITLDLCDLVILLNNTLSSDKVLQQMYRCMTEGKDKKIGFVVDLNISRVLNTCIEYTTYKNAKSINEKLTYLVNNNLINIDVDMLENKDINSTDIINKLISIWKKDPINSFKILFKKLDNIYESFDNNTQKLLNDIFSKNIKDKFNLQITTYYDNIQELPTGKEKIQLKTNKTNENDETNENTENTELKTKETQISFAKDILPHVIPLVCILTIKEHNIDFIEMLNIISKNKELLDIFNDQCSIWWNKQDLIELIKDIIVNNFSNVYLHNDISIQIKMSLKSLIDNPKKLLELIADCLKPKDVEKKQFGEVFTPMNLVNEMLDKLPNEVWYNKDLKWLDPAAGMGNFPIAVYLRLMETLKEVISNDLDRKKHILENMLYLSELNKKNVYLCKQIFDINNEYKLNIHEGDSLVLDYEKTFKVNKFDIIIGNPPYNVSRLKASGNTLWQLFIELSFKLLKPNGYLCFIHPNAWRKPNTEKCKSYGLFEKMTKSNTMLYLEIHNSKDGIKQFNCGTRYDWYILQNTKNKNYKTKILDQNNILHEINLSKYNWLANCELELIDKLIANENDEKCKILYSRSSYSSEKKWISKIETKEFKYPVIHTTPKDKPRLLWSNKNDNGHYGIKKIIFGDSGINNPIIDMDGKYAMSGHAMAIVINNIEEGEKLSKILCSTLFNTILKACLWSSFAIEWRMFGDFKKEFYNILEDLSEDLDQLDNLNTKEVKEVKEVKKKIIRKSKKQSPIIEFNDLSEDLDNLDQLDKLNTKEQLNNLNTIEEPKLLKEVKKQKNRSKKQSPIIEFNDKSEDLDQLDKLNTKEQLNNLNTIEEPKVLKVLKEVKKVKKQK